MRNLTIIFACLVALFSGTAIACCIVVPPDLLSRLEDKASTACGPQIPTESSRAYHARCNQILISLLAKEPGDILMSLQAESDEQLCYGPCVPTYDDVPPPGFKRPIPIEPNNVRQVLAAAMAVKTADDSGNWNWRMFLLGVITTVISVVGVLVSLVQLGWMPTLVARKKPFE
jgi:hypothetical protein